MWGFVLLFEKKTQPVLKTAQPLLSQVLPLFSSVFLPSLLLRN